MKDEGFLIDKLFREEKARFANAVAEVGEAVERDRLPELFEALAKWAGTHLWLTGYRLEKFEAFSKQFDYGRKLGLGVELDVQKIPLTVRQFCYEFLEFADEIRKENDKLKSFWFYRFCNWIKRLWT